jgi:CopG family nickel-responsive transcriptional regulator
VRLPLARGLWYDPRAEESVKAKAKTISLSVDAGVLGRFDAWLAAQGIANRSSGVERLMRERLDRLALSDESAPAVATVTYIYDHHRRELMERLAHLQHEHLAEVVSSMHVHLDHERCLEVLVLRGPARVVRALGERIAATRGVERGEVVVSSAGRAAGGRAGEHAEGGPSWHAHAHEHGIAHEHEHERAREAGRARSAKRARAKRPAK